MKSLRARRNGVVLLESLTALTISLMIILTLTYCVSEQFKLLNNWEQRVNAHKVILLHLQNKNIPDPIIIRNQEYYFFHDQNKYQVKVGENVYQIES